MYKMLATTALAGILVSGGVHAQNQVMEDAVNRGLDLKYGDARGDRAAHDFEENPEGLRRQFDSLSRDGFITYEVEKNMDFDAEYEFQSAVYRSLMRERYPLMSEEEIDQQMEGMPLFDMMGKIRHMAESK